MNYLSLYNRASAKIRTILYQYYNRLRFGLMGIKYGTNLRVYDKVYVSGEGSIKIGNDFVLTSGDNINPICRNIRGSFYVPFKDSRIIIGDRVGISSGCLWAHVGITIGNNVNIGGDCLIMDNDAHPHDYIKRRSDYIKSKEGMHIVMRFPQLQL